MEKLQIIAPAKINLGLDVLAKRADGYHEVKMIMQNISLADVITISHKVGEDELTCNVKDLPTDNSNIALKAWHLLKNAYKLPQGIHIHIEKSIPLAAGLAGGSANAAAVLKGVNSIFGLGLSNKEMQNHGVKLGADVPFSILGGTALAEGIGEKLTSLASCPTIYVLAVNPGFPVHTPQVYQNLKLDKIKERPNIDDMIIAIKNGDKDRIISDIGNVLEQSSFELYPILSELKAEIASFDVKAMMSGSGGTVLGLSTDKDRIAYVATKMQEKWPLVYTATTLNQA